MNQIGKLPDHLCGSENLKKKSPVAKGKKNLYRQQSMEGTIAAARK